MNSETCCESENQRGNRKNRSGFSALRPSGMLHDGNLQSRIHIIYRFHARILFEWWKSNEIA